MVYESELPGQVDLIKVLIKILQASRRGTYSILDAGVQALAAEGAVTMCSVCVERKDIGTQTANCNRAERTADKEYPVLAKFLAHSDVGPELSVYELLCE